MTTRPSVSVFRCVSTCFSSGPPTASLHTYPWLHPSLSPFPALCLCPGVRTSCIFPPCFLSVPYHVFSNNPGHNFLSTFVVAAVLKQVLGRYLACKCVLLDGIGGPMCSCLCVRPESEMKHQRGEVRVCSVRGKKRALYFNLLAWQWMLGTLLREYKELFFFELYRKKKLVSARGMDPWALSVSAQLKGINLDKIFTVLFYMRKKKRSGQWLENQVWTLTSFGNLN